MSNYFSITKIKKRGWGRILSNCVKCCSNNKKRKIKKMIWKVFAKSNRIIENLHIVTSLMAATNDC